MRFSPRIFLCTLVILLLAAAAQAQTPTSGPMLTIKNSGGTILVQVYDSQIHSGTVHAVPLLGGTPACAAGDQSFPTDAYVLQGGSATGCDPTDSFEVTDLATSATTFTPRTDANAHQLPGSRDIGGFHIETHYICAGACAPPTPPPSFTGGYCNTSGTICTAGPGGPDTGFLIVTNNTGSQFNGTITLQGTSAIAGAPFCPTATDANGHGVASDSWTAGLAAGQSVTLALGTPPPPLDPSTSDSSNCGGFNFDQTLPITQTTEAGTTQLEAIFLFGEDKFVVDSVNANTGDQITFRPVPEPAGLFNVASGFGQGQKCISVRDFAAAGNPVCPELQTHCHNSLGNNDVNGNCNDAETFFWTGEFKAHLDPNAGYPLVSGLPEVGGVHFLGHPMDNCPQNMFSKDIIISYTGDSLTDLPLKPGGSGLNCFVASWDPSQPAVAPGVTVKAFDGPTPPVEPPPAINMINPGQAVALKFTLSDGAGGPGDPNYQLCPSGPTAPGSQVCKDPVPAPWVFLARNNVACPAASTVLSTTTIAQSDDLATISGLQNLGGGQYQYNWKTLKTEPVNTCANVNVLLSTGAAVVPFASFEFVNH